MQVNARQEKGLQMMDKEQSDYPKLFKALTEELRIAKVAYFDLVREE
jgi:hypothetical protein